MQGLYVERVQRMMLPDPVTRDRGLDAAKLVYQYGDIEPVCAFVEDVYFSVFKNRDYARSGDSGRGNTGWGFSVLLPNWWLIRRALPRIW